MPREAPTRYRPWLESPLRTSVGEVQLAGMLQNVPGIDAQAMRVLGAYALILMAEGNGYYTDAAGRTESLAAGDVVWVFPEIAHAYGAVAGGAWTQIYFVFSGAQFDLWRTCGMLTPDTPVWRLGAVDFWRQRLAEVLEGEPLHSPGAATRVLGRFSHVILEMAAAHAEVTSGRRDDWLEQSLRLLGDRGARGWLSPAEVARQVGLNYENFRKRFVQQTGESPGHYQKRRRIDWARAALYHGEHSLKDIADSLGFCDVFHFSKAFKRIAGTSPSDYRRKVRGY